MTQKSREEWSSRFVFVLATTGAAVGLGNIWKFPYMAGSDGGNTFFVLYLICIVLIGLPVMISELIMGKRGRSNPVNTLRYLAYEAKAPSQWIYLGWWSALTLLLAFSFYSVVASWGIAYIYYTWSGYITQRTAPEIHQLWEHFLAQPWQMLFWDTLFIITTGYIVARGVKKGLEWASLILMPALLVILVILAIYGSMHGNFAKAWSFLFGFKWHMLTWSVFIDALGHAFFSLAVGACAILVYGSYLPRDMEWFSTICYIIILDVFVAIVSGLAIFPLVFAHGLQPGAGPGLMFESLPIAFANMPAGGLIGSAFFLLLLFAAWSSSISLAEPLVTLLIERHNMVRWSATVLVSILAWLLSIASILSFNVWHQFKLFGRWDLFSTITDLATNIMLPIGGLAIALFAGWVMNIQQTKEEFQQHHPMIYYAWRFIVRYITPVGISLILVGSLLQN